MNDAPSATRQSTQLLHLVFGGGPKELPGTEFPHPAERDSVGVFPNFASACAAWWAKAQTSLDNALMRTFIVHLHRVLDPVSDRA